MKKIGSALATALIAVLLTLFTFSVTFSLLLTPWPTHIIAGWFADEGPSGYTHEQMVEVADGILRYSLGDNDVSFPEGDSTITTIDEQSLAHLRDCRTLFRGVIALAAGMTLVCLIAIIASLVKRKKKMLGRAMTGAFFLMLFLVIMFVVWAVADFGSFFDWLHHFFFASGSWYFAADSLMICAVPTKFWVSMGVLWALLIVVFCLIWWFAGKRLRKR